MGGIGIVLAILIVTSVSVNLDFAPRYLAVLLMMLAFAAIGLADDLLKIFRRQNLGLTFWQKIILQAAAAGLNVLLEMDFNAREAKNKTAA